jgi:hypothetical protein
VPQHHSGSSTRPGPEHSTDLLDAGGHLPVGCAGIRLLNPPRAVSRRERAADADDPGSPGTAAEANRPAADAGHPERHHWQQHAGWRYHTKLADSIAHAGGYLGDDDTSGTGTDPG